jgi:hypothetical protein
MFCITGCAFQNPIRTIGFSNTGLKKKIAILPAEQVLKDERLKLLFEKSLADNIEKKCSDMILLKPEQTKSLQTSDNLALAEAGKALGVNAIVRARLGTVSIGKEEKGFPMFKRLRNIASVYADIQILDTATAAKLIEQSLTRNTEANDADIDLIKTGKDFGGSFMGNMLSDMAAEFAVKICDTITVQPWQSYVVSGSKGVFTISGGKDAGIQPGELLNVYDRGETLSGAEGQRFFKPGPKIGELKVIAVFPDRAEAIAFAGKDFREGSSVRQK